MPEELSPHLCEQPTDLTLTEQVGAAGRERGVHSSSMCLDDLHTHETHGQSAPTPGKEGLVISSQTALQETHHVYTQCISQSVNELSVISLGFPTQHYTAKMNSKPHFI